MFFTSTSPVDETKSFVSVLQRVETKLNKNKKAVKKGFGFFIKKDFLYACYNSGTICPC
jgi:hypothetical protein